MKNYTLYVKCEHILTRKGHVTSPSVHRPPSWRWLPRGVAGDGDPAGDGGGAGGSGGDGAEGSGGCGGLTVISMAPYPCA